MRHSPSVRSYSPSQECEKLIDKINRMNIKRDTKISETGLPHSTENSVDEHQTRASPVSWRQSDVNTHDPFDLDLPQEEHQEAMTNIPPRHQVYEGDRNPQQYWDDGVHHPPPPPRWHRPPHHWGRPPHRGRGPRGLGHPLPHCPPPDFYCRGKRRGSPPY